VRPRTDPIAVAATIAIETRIATSRGGRRPPDADAARAGIVPSQARKPSAIANSSAVAGIASGKPESPQANSAARQPAAAAAIVASSSGARACAGSAAVRRDRRTAIQSPTA
jgi:hypothetical protein